MLLYSQFHMPFFHETFFREMLLCDVSQKFFVVKVFSYTVYYNFCCTCNMSVNNREG